MLRQDADQGKVNITTATTTQVKNGPGVLGRVVVGTPISAGTIAIYDARSGTTSPIALITSTADVKPFSVEFNCQVTNGIRVVTAQAQDVTITFN